MSRIGKKPIPIPDTVKVQIDGRKVRVQGPKGALEWELPARTNIKIDDRKIIIGRDGDDPQAKALHGLSRALVNNMVKGVTEGFTKKLEIHGVGFKASLQGNTLTMSLGKSHPVVYQVPPQLKVTVEENTKITIEGVDKQLVGQVAAEIRALYPPEPYKGKGIRYAGEHIVRKVGKTVQ
ncbi:MAG: 50S ribosomal protein L6 [Verrucomicrobiae bacterium]|nr:50S ribosomal protein L6 [Verrucomicrobiae bacterium]MCX7722122.1 50S ribosomal protein L6 [Verrucomicrobiae bacterium]MDW7979387.1 50S ribosomal protein L6 [Verrucomicrobiales bacterium]